MQAHLSRSMERDGNEVIELDPSRQRPTLNRDLESSSIRQEENSNAHSDSIRANSKPLRNHPLLVFGWWWEFGAIVVSLVSMTLIITILLAMNGKPLQYWKLPIQINSLVAVLSTIARSASLLILAEGLSQLKWNHFEKPASTLDQLQTFDDASRGPWGALMFFLKMKKGIRILTAIGAALTVLALAFEPFTQQVLEFPSRKISITNGTAYVHAAEEFVLREWSSSTKQGGPKLTMLRSIVELLPDPSARINSHFVCSNGDCEMPAHWSLAACTDCKDTILDQSMLACFFELPSQGETAGSTLEDFKSFARENGLGTASIWCQNMSPVGPRRASEDNPYPLTPWWDITQPIDVDGDSSFYDYYEDADEYTSNHIFTVDSTKIISGFPNIENLEQWPGVIANRTRCKIKYCVKEMAPTIIKNGGIQGDEIYEELPLTFSNACGTDAKCPNISATFQRHTRETQSVQINTEFRKNFGHDVAEVLSRVMDMEVTEKYLIGLEARDIAGLMGTVLDSFMRSSQNAKATNRSGSAISTETYVRVKWEWIIFPIVIVLGSLTFLVLTILESRTRMQLFKTSVLTGFFVRWEGARESRLGKESQYNYEGLLQEGKESRVQLTKNEEGELLFASTDRKL